MRLGISYNLFDGEELLEPSIRSVRNNVDYISVVYQNVSNLGNKRKDITPFLNDLKKKKLIDEIIIYNPKLNIHPAQNETAKRNIGLELSRRNGCTHHMSMDCDEFYIGSQLEWLKNEIEEKGYDSSYSQMVTYFKKPTYRVVPDNQYYVSLIFKIKEENKYVLGFPVPVLVDPTRRMNGNSIPLICKREDIEMHHMSYVRKNIRNKIENSTSSNAFLCKDEFYEMFNKYELGNVFFTTNTPGRETTRLVENIFNINEKMFETLNKNEKQVIKENKNKIALYTAIFGNYETLKNPVKINGIDYICFTDNKELKSDFWKIIYIDSEGKSSSFEYKKIKCLSHLYLPDYEYTIWLDANFCLKDKNYLKFLMNNFKSNKLMLYKHHCLARYPRNCAYKEAEYSMNFPKYKEEKLQEQIDDYKKEGFPEHWGLFQSGFLMRNNKDEEAIQFNEKWLIEIEKYGKISPQCQVSLPYILWKTNIKFDIINSETIWNTNRFIITFHGTNQKFTPAYNK